MVLNEKRTGGGAGRHQALEVAVCLARVIVDRLPERGGRLRLPVLRPQNLGYDVRDKGLRGDRLEDQRLGRSGPVSHAYESDCNVCV